MRHDEWIRSVLKNRPDLTRAQLERTRDLMNAHARDALIRDFEDLIPSLSLPDPDDRHVLAAAIRGRADVIVTYNMKDFPAEAIAPYGIEIQHPDKFLSHVFALSPGAVLGALQRLRQSLKNPPLASFPLDLHDKRVTRTPPATEVLPQRAALDEIQDVTVGRVLRALGELGVFGCRELSLEAVE
jgi:PIN domain-containing protein